MTPRLRTVRTLSLIHIWASDELDMERVQRGNLSPVFFGSALTNFGVETFLEHFLKMTTAPLSRRTLDGEIDPFRPDFSAFVFKIQANMNKAHRDRIAFMRICSGKFEAGMEVNHVQGGRKIRLTQPQQLMAQDRKIVEEAYAGDIIGVFDPGIFSIGDTLCTSGDKFQLCVTLKSAERATSSVRSSMAIWRR